MNSDTDSYGYPLVAAPDAPDVNPLNIGHRVGPFSPYDTTTLRGELEEDEGRKSHPYRCPAGHLTIGIGHNLDANGLPDPIIDALFLHDMQVAVASLDYLDPGWRNHPDPVRRAMVNLVFNMGPGGWAKFKNTRAALSRRDYESAAQGLERSKWATQVQRSRSKRIIAQVRGAATSA